MLLLPGGMLRIAYMHALGERDDVYGDDVYPNCLQLHRLLLLH